MLFYDGEAVSESKHSYVSPFDLFIPGPSCSPSPKTFHHQASQSFAAVCLAVVKATQTVIEADVRVRW